MSIVIQKIFFEVIIVHKVIISWGFSIFKHVKSNIVGVVIVRLEVVQLHLSVLKPLVSILEHLIVETLKVFQLILNMGKILLEDCFCCLFLYLKHDSHFLKFIFKLIFQILRFHFELVINKVDLCFVWLFCGRLGKVLIHLHETLSSYVDLLKHVLLHSDVVRLVVSKESTVRADALLAIDADDFDFALMHWAHVSSVFFLHLRDSSIRSD